MRQTTILLAASAATLGACATAPETAGPADFTPIASTPSANARLYADCIAQATQRNRYGHAYEEVHVVIFTCDGAPARAFFDALGPWAASQNSEVVTGGRTIRATTRIERDLFAADYCEKRGEAVTCSISLRTGEFARP
ncbi:MAG TPA: hypothetical protein VGR32_10790 [Brevundimonas sp.]|jgi:hypothetical protein|uniref:hypothetical protein n=1 Tax=Brevundimonas sp. TaxID=1871086 RepID=UPI002DEB2C4B|nr:hypothetical protein [Brevundimonas sp.]